MNMKKSRSERKQAGNKPKPGNKETNIPKPETATTGILQPTSGNSGAGTPNHNTKSDPLNIVGKEFKTSYGEPFIVDKLLGNGGMGVVYRAHFKNEPNKVAAFKTLLPQFVHYEECERRFAHEAWFCRNLSHPNIVGLIDFYKTKDGYPYMLQEYINGRTLDCLLREKLANEKKRYSPQEAFKVLKPILEAIIELHRKNFIHRDLKPSNIMVEVTADGHIRVVMLDFGIAKLLPGVDSEELTKLTRPGSPIGTLAYMSPEQCDHTGKAKVTFQSDIFTMGVIFYELIAGYPFKLENQQGMWVRHLNDVTPLHLTCKGVTEDFSAVIMQMISIEPERRQSNIEEVILALEDALKDPEYLDSKKRFKLGKRTKVSDKYTKHLVEDAHWKTRKLEAKVFNEAESQNIRIEDITGFAEISNDGVIRIADYGKKEDDERVYIIYESAEGKSLKDLLDNKICEFNLSSVIHYGLKISQAVDAFHQKGSGVSYKHLVPANIFIYNYEGGFGIVKILHRLLLWNVKDQISIEVDVNDDLVLTSQIGFQTENMALPTDREFYQSPERRDNKVKESHQDDCYTICMVMAKMLFGDDFIITSSEDEKLSVIETARQKSTDRSFRNFCDLLKKGLSADQSVRYKNTSQLLTALSRASSIEISNERVEPDLNIAPPQPAQPSQMVQSSQNRWLSKKRVQVAATFILGVPVLGAFFHATVNSKVKTPEPEKPITIAQIVPTMVSHPTSNILVPICDNEQLSAIMRLQAQGMAAIKAGRVLEPVQDCANYYLMQIMHICPNSPLAQDLIEHMCEYYVARAEESTKKNNLRLTCKWYLRYQAVRNDQFIRNKLREFPPSLIESVRKV